MADGILIIDKPQGWTSMDVCAKLRGMFSEKRVGHAGTLDPMATGVLPVFLGRATRAVEFAERGNKEYLATLRLGQVTDTQDITGTILEQHPVSVDQSALEQILPRFTGEIQQIPPMYSAIKVNGKKLYQLARQGKTVERKPRNITIYSLSVTEQFNETDYALRVQCSKGTYIRTLCHDIGMALSCGGTMAALRRTEAAGFSLSQAVTLEQVQAATDAGTAETLLLPVDTYFSRYPSVSIQGRSEHLCRNGNAFSCPGENGLFRVYSAKGEFLMLGERKDNVMSTIKSFFAPMTK